VPAKKKRHRVAVTADTEAGATENAGATQSGAAAGRCAPPKKPVRRKRKKAPPSRFARWRARIATFQRTVGAVPPAIRTVVVVVLALVLFAAANLVYQVIRKPAEMFFPVSGVLKKMPAETWRQYASFFRAYSTADISPELLAALAQVEGAGDPMAHTYWRWRLTWDLFSIYRPASSAVGMYQMTDPAFADSRRYCIRHHSVVAAGAWNDWQSCWFNDLYTRVIPSHAIELTAVSLDRNVRAILPRPLAQKASPQQKQDLAAIIHLCGASPARAFAHRGFQLSPDERCGDHSAAAYLAQVNAMKRQFERLAATDQENAK
jgi:hypothetical protein